MKPLHFSRSSLLLRTPKRPSGRRGGFLTLGLILCLILILTVAAVLWNYQYLTIQNLELECAARSAIQGTMASGTLLTAINAGTEGNPLNCTPLQTILDQTTSRQSRNAGTITVTLVNQATPILAFRQHRKMGLFKGVFKTSKVNEIENEDFVQYYSFTRNAPDGPLTGFTKTYPVTP